MSVIGILVLLAVPKFIGHTKEAKLTKFIANTKSLETASERYYMDTQLWPKTSDEAYSAEQIKNYSQKIYDSTGKITTLDPNGKYYDIDYESLSKYISIPDNKEYYIIQNPVGNVYALEGLTEEGKARIINNKPTAVITMTPDQSITQETNIIWTYNSSTDPDGDKIVNAEWDGAFPKYSTPGTYTVKLRVQDEHGIWSDWTEKTFTVISSNHAPVAVINMFPLTNIFTTTNVEFNASSSTDQDGDTISATQWQLDGGTITSNAPTGTFSQGAHTIKLRVQDSKGEWSEWVQITFNVSIATNVVNWSSSAKDPLISLTNNNLTAYIPASGGGVKSNVSKSSGKWYWEVKIDSSSVGSRASIFVGIISASASNYRFDNVYNRAYYGYGGDKYSGVTPTPYSTSYGEGDIIGVALDMDNGTIGFYKNGTYLGVAYTDLKNIGAVSPCISGGSSLHTVQATGNFGESTFKYAIPSGYRPINQS